MSKILKNQTGSIVDITDVGVSVPASGQLVINSTDFDDFASSDDVITLVGNGTLLVNNGSTDLSIADGIRLIQGGFSGKLLLNDNLINSDRIKINLDNTLTGPQGPSGADGNEWLNGSGAPSNGLGNDDDLYLDDSTGDIYRKSSGTWSQIGNIEGPQGAQGPQGPASTFGSEYQRFTSLAQSSTTSASYVQKASFNTTNLPTGNYFFRVQYKWRQSNTGDDFRARVQIDNTTTLFTHQQEPKDAGSDQQMWFHWSDEVALSGTHQIDIDFSEQQGSTAFISDVTIILWRIN